MLARHSRTGPLRRLERPEDGHPQVGVRGAVVHRERSAERVAGPGGRARHEADQARQGRTSPVLGARAGPGVG